MPLYAKNQGGSLYIQREQKSQQGKPLGRKHSDVKRRGSIVILLLVAAGDL